MTAAVAKTRIEEIILTVLKDPTVRENLDANLHVLDIGYNSISAANTPRSSSRAAQAEIDMVSYGEFISTVRGMVPTASTFNLGIQDVLAAKAAGRNNVYRLVDDYLLICASFGAARALITAVSRKIPNNVNFGTSYRERSLDEYNVEYDMKSKNLAGSLARLKDKAFISPRGYIGQVQADTSTGQRTRYVFQERTAKRFTHVAIRNPDGSMEFEAKTKHLNSQIEVKDGSVILVDYTDEFSKRKQTVPVIKKQELSVLDLGHLFKLDSPTGRTPLGTKFYRASEQLGKMDKIGFKDIGLKAQAEINKFIRGLDHLHSNIIFDFHNAAADSTKVEGNVGYVILSVQHHRANNALAVGEGRLMRHARERLAQLAIDLPGSNTMREDLVQKTADVLVEALGGKGKKLTRHGVVKGKVPLPNLKPVFGNKVVTTPDKRKISTKAPSIVFRNTSGQFTSLASLQAMLNLALHDQIQKNMGTGSRRDVLNYRTGRFAKSAEVTKMSQSREGMITAFYTYMKNPYATFSEGGMQATPKTRDPKLLISKSIRELLSAQVNNRMRAVLA